MIPRTHGEVCFIINCQLYEQFVLWVLWKCLGGNSSVDEFIVHTGLDGTSRFTDTFGDTWTHVSSAT